MLPPADSPAMARRDGVAVPRFGVLEHPLIGREGIVVRGRELGLGSLAVFDARHDGVGLAGERHGGRLVGVEVGDHPAAAVDVDDHRQRPRRALGRVDADRLRSARRRVGHVLLGDLHGGHQRHRILALILEHGHDGVSGRRLLARLLDGELLDRLGAELHQLLQHQRHVFLVGALHGAAVVLRHRGGRLRGAAWSARPCWWQYRSKRRATRSPAPQS